VFSVQLAENTRRPGYFFSFFVFEISINTRAVICLKKLQKCSVVFVFLLVISEVVLQLRIGKLAHFGE
jgi:hypothetical protein